MIDVRRDGAAATWPVRIAGYRVTGLDEKYVAQANSHRSIGQANQVTAFGQTIELASSEFGRIFVEALACLPEQEFVENGIVGSRHVDSDRSGKRAALIDTE